MPLLFFSNTNSELKDGKAKEMRETQGQPFKQDHFIHTVKNTVNQSSDGMAKMMYIILEEPVQL